MAKRDMPTANDAVVEDVKVEKKEEAVKETKPKKKCGVAKSS